MKLILIVTPAMKPIPTDIQIHQVFGEESVVTGNPPHLAPNSVGESMFVEGSPESISNWLRQFDVIWTSNNPMTGNWNAQHPYIK